MNIEAMTMTEKLLLIRHMIEREELKLANDHKPTKYFFPTLKLDNAVLIDNCVVVE